MGHGLLGAGRRAVGAARGLPRRRVITLSPDGERLASLSSDGAVRVWTVDDRRPLGAAAATFDDVGFATAVAFSPDGTLAIAGDFSRVVLVDPVTGDEQPAMRLPDGEPTAVEFSHDGTVLAVANSDGRTQLFDVTTRLELGPPLAASSSASTTSPSAPTTPAGHRRHGPHRRAVAPRRRPRHRRACRATRRPSPRWPTRATGGTSSAAAPTAARHPGPRRGLHPIDRRRRRGPHRRHRPDRPLGGGGRRQPAR